MLFTLVNTTLLNFLNYKLRVMFGYWKMIGKGYGEEKWKEKKGKKIEINFFLTKPIEHMNVKKICLLLLTSSSKELMILTSDTKYESNRLDVGCPYELARLKRA